MGKGSGKENAEKTRSEEEREAQTQRASKEIEKGRRRKKDKARGTEAKREPHRGKWERDTGTKGRTRPRERVCLSKRDSSQPPSVGAGRGLRQLLSWS